MFVSVEEFFFSFLLHLVEYSEDFFFCFFFSFSKVYFNMVHVNRNKLEDFYYLA